MNRLLTCAILFAALACVAPGQSDDLLVRELAIAAKVPAHVEAPDPLDETVDDLTAELDAGLRPPLSTSGQPALPLRARGSFDHSLLPDVFQDPASAPDATVAPEPEVKKGPWRLNDELQAAGAPEWLRVSGTIRLRYEGISGQFRSAARLDNSDHVFVMRTTLKVETDFDPVLITLEGVDSRQYGGDENSALNTATVNAVELLQAHVTFRLGELGSGTHKLRFGRQTFNLGSRRLVARNRYRNTINAFTGLFWEWKSEESTLTAFYTLPIRRLPNDLSSVVDNEMEFDEEDFDQQFFGLHFQSVAWEKFIWDVYAFGLLEQEDLTRDRDIFTFGGRFLLPKSKGEFDYQIEGALQVGDSRLSGSGDRLDHFAGFVHISLGYTFDCPWSPRLRIALDFASGDDDPTDDDNNRFETLFGARRFEYGPTGIYGAIARFNLLSPDVRIELKPHQDMTLFFAYRTFLLASDTDAWTAARVQDPSGNSGSLVGHQVETRWRWEVIPKSIRVELALAYLIGEEFQEDAPGGQDTDTFYGSAQIAFTF